MAVSIYIHLIMCSNGKRHLSVGHTSFLTKMLITVARYTFPYEAQIAWSRLDAEGIPAYIADEHTINMQWLYSNALGGVRVQVPTEYEEVAREILERNLEDELIEQEGFEGTKCPKCGSTDTTFYQFGKRFAFLVFLGLHFPLFPVKNGVICNQCGAKSKINQRDQA